ncbi:MAG: iron-containing alcohol dehydrogenase family protein [Dehalococcoidia bacterium]
MDSATHLDYRANTVDHDIICAPDSISGMAESLERLGISRALAVCGPTILEHADVVQRVQRALGDRCIGLYSGVAPHAPVEMLEEAVSIARELQPDSLVAVGGGSTSDTCKGIAVMLAEGGEVTDYAIQFEPPDKVFIPDTPHDKIPIIAVPTTMGGAELSSGGGGFTSKALGRKLSLAGKGTTPKVIIIDGEALATTPMGILLSTAMGQFRIAVESIYSRDHFPIADALALHTIKMLVDYLPRCSGGDIDCLLQAKTAAIMVMLVRPGLGLNTATAHHVGGLYDVPHGEANAILLPHTMRFNLDACADRQALTAQAMGIDTSGMTDHEAGLAASDGVARLCRSLGIPERLRDVGVPEDGLELIAAATLHDRGLATNPKPVHDAGPIMSVLRAAW